VSAPGGGRILLTAFVALVLTVLPLPPWLDVLRPVFLVLAVLYWSVNAPRTGDIALGFFAGLALDVFQGPVLGQHALALALVTYIAVREHQRIRSKPRSSSADRVRRLGRLRVRAVRDRRLERPPGHESAALGPHRDRCTGCGLLSPPYWPTARAGAPEWNYPWLTVSDGF